MSIYRYSRQSLAAHISQAVDPRSPRQSEDRPQCRMVGHHRGRPGRYLGEPSVGHHRQPAGQQFRPLRLARRPARQDQSQDRAIPNGWLVPVPTKPAERRARPAPWPSPPSSAGPGSARARASRQQALPAPADRRSRSLTPAAWRDRQASPSTGTGGYTRTSADPFTTVIPGSAQARSQAAPRARRTTLRIRASSQARAAGAHSPSASVTRGSDRNRSTARAAPFQRIGPRRRRRPLHPNDKRQRVLRPLIPVGRLHGRRRLGARSFCRQSPVKHVSRGSPAISRFCVPAPMP